MGMNQSEYRRFVHSGPSWNIIRSQTLDLSDSSCLFFNTNGTGYWNFENEIKVWRLVFSPGLIPWPLAWCLIAHVHDPWSYSKDSATNLYSLFITCIWVIPPGLRTDDIPTWHRHKSCPNLVEWAIYPTLVYLVLCGCRVGLTEPCLFLSSRSVLVIDDQWWPPISPVPAQAKLLNQPPLTFDIKSINSYIPSAKKVSKFVLTSDWRPWTKILTK